MANPNMQVGMPSVNPKGRPVGIIHTLNDRRNRFLEELTRGEILALASDEERLNREYHAFDAQVIVGLAETLMFSPPDKLNPAKAREDLYDRAIGKAAQSVNVNHSGSVAVFTVDVSPALAFLAGDGEGSEKNEIGGIGAEGAEPHAGLLPP